jgi:hypothetical protein
VDCKGSRHRDASLEAKEQIKVAGDPWFDWQHGDGP